MSKKTRRLYQKLLTKTDYSDQKQYRQHKDQRNKNNQKTKWEEKQLYGHFKQQTSKNLIRENLDMLRKQNLKREIEFLLIAAQNNAIRTMSKQK